MKLNIPTVARADLAYWLASATIQLERRIPLIAVATKNGATVCEKNVKNVMAQGHEFYILVKTKNLNNNECCKLCCANASTISILE